MPSPAARFLLACLATLPLIACSTTGRPNLPSGTDFVPMVVENSLPFVQVQIGGETYQFLVDTGASDCVISPQIAQRIGAKSLQEAVPVRSSSGDRIMLSMVQVPSLKLGSTVFHHVPALVLETSRLRGLNREVHGVVGFGLFRDHLMTLDYGKRRLGVSPWREILPNERGSVPFVYSSGVPAVPVTGTLTTWADVDSGSTGGLEILPAKVGLQTVSAPKPGVLASSITGHFRQNVARLKGSVFIGEIEMQYPIVDIAHADQRIGGEILSNLIVVFDQRSRRAILRFGPTPGFGKPVLGAPPMRTTGVAFDPRWVVADIMPGTSAAKLPIRVGDRCVAVNSLPVTEISPAEYDSILSSNAVVSFTIQRGSRKFTVQAPVDLHVR